MWQFIVNNIWSILSVIVAIAGVVFGTVFKNTKVGKVFQGFAKVLKSLPDFIRQAEKITSDPTERKTYVLNLFIVHCLANGFEPTEEQLVDVSLQIDDLVKLSKDINVDSKNKTQPTATVINKINTIGGGNGAN